MSSPRTVPSDGVKDVVTFTIKVNGSDLPQTMEVSAITTMSAIGRIPFARIEILDGDPAAQTFAASEDSNFDLGNPVEIHAGYSSEESLIFSGEIVGQKIRVRQSGRALLTILVRHAIYKAALTKRSKTYHESTDSEAIATALEDYDVSLSIDTTDVTHEALFQYDTTDWDFALNRAESSGLFLIPGTHGVSAKFSDTSQDPELELQFGATVFELDLEIDARRQPESLTGVSWDPAAQDIIESTGEEPELPSAGDTTPAKMAQIHAQSEVFQHPAAVTQEELDAFTSGALLVQRLQGIVGRVQCTGSSNPKPGGILNLTGVGKHFSGDHLISAVRHVIQEGSWTTDIQVGLPNQSASASPKAPVAGTQIEMLPPTKGLHLGKVEDLESDPLGEFRVLVLSPSLGEDAEPVWARLATFDAGENRGSFFYPEVGDEVVVGFLNDDPRYPIVLGSLHSSTHTAPLEPANDNHEKGFVSRSEMKLLFNDDLNSVLIETPSGNKLELSEDSGGILIEDENGNKLELNSDGILIESASDLTLKASGDISMEGSNITAEAQQQFTGKGNSGSELSASGTTTVKGALVQIN